MEHAITRYWPTELQQVMKNCWSASPAQRPSFVHIVSVLQQIIDTLRMDIARNSNNNTFTVNKSSNTSLPSAVKNAATNYPSSSINYKNNNIIRANSSTPSDDEDNKSLAANSEDNVSTAPGGMARNITSSLGLAWEKAQSSNARLQGPQPRRQDMDDDDDDDDEQVGDDNRNANDNLSVIDDSSMIRSRRFGFFPRLSMFASSSQRGRSRSRSVDRDRRKRQRSFGFVTNFMGNSSTNPRSRSNDSVNSEQRRRSRRGIGLLRSKSGTNLSTTRVVDTSPASTVGVPPALISGASVIQLLTSNNNDDDRDGVSSQQTSSLPNGGRGASSYEPLLFPHESPSRRPIPIISKDSEASVGKEHETMTTVTTSSCGGGEDLDLSFHSAVMEFMEEEADDDDSNSCHTRSTPRNHCPSLAAEETVDDDNDDVANYNSKDRGLLSMLVPTQSPHTSISLSGPTRMNTLAAAAQARMSHSKAFTMLEILVVLGLALLILCLLQSSSLS